MTSIRGNGAAAARRFFQRAVGGAFHDDEHLVAGAGQPAQAGRSAPRSTRPPRQVARQPAGLVVGRDHDGQGGLTGKGEDFCHESMGRATERQNARQNAKRSERRARRAKRGNSAFLLLDFCISHSAFCIISSSASWILPSSSRSPPRRPPADSGWRDPALVGRGAGGRLRGSGGSTDARRTSTRASTAGSPTRCSTSAATSTTPPTTTVRCTSTSCSSSSACSGATSGRCACRPCIVGVLTVDWMFRFERFLGRRACAWAALAMTLSPGVLYYQRDAIHETWLVFFLVLGFWGLSGCGRRARNATSGPWAWRWPGMILTKETYLIHLGCLALAVPCLLLAESLQPSAGRSCAWCRKGPTRRRPRGPGRAGPAGRRG